jgi:exodeoxyribonuclease VII large subunit
MDEPAPKTAAPGAGATISNVPEYSVSEISGAVKRVLEGSFSRIRVRGEITEFKRYPSGHLYFSLKDEGGKIAGVSWRNSVARLGLVPENGLEVIATGRISSYGERSSYQLIVERMEYAGEGALLARIERLRLKLGAEGLFDADRKRPLPFLPRLIGLVTSPQGAVLHDIRTTISRRFPRALLLWPVPVQGEGAAARIAAAIDGFDRRTGPGTGAPRPDLLIVARGGGSLEDLMAFSDEAVLRAVAACRIPIISAVGHETDTTLIDFVSDRRAPTPTAAAEIAVPARVELLADLAHRAARLDSGLARLSQGLRLRFDRAAGLLPDLPSLLGHMRQRLDDRLHRLELAGPGQLGARRNALRELEHRLQRALPSLMASRRAALVTAERHMPDPHRLIELRRGRIALFSGELRRALPALLASRRTALVTAERHMPAPQRPVEIRRGHLAVVAARLQAGLRQTLRDAAADLRQRSTVLAGLAARLDSVSPGAVLARGYVLVRDAGGHAVTEGAALRPGARLSLAFADGERQVRVERDGTSQGALDI